MSKSIWMAGRPDGDALLDNQTRSFGFGADLERGANQVHDVTLPEAATISDLTIRATDNTLTVDAVFTAQKDYVDTALTLTFASTDADIEKTSATTVAFASGTAPTCEVVIATGGTSIIVTCGTISVDPDTATNTISVFKSFRNGALSLTAAETKYLAPVGETDIDGTEANVHLSTPIAGTVKNFGASSATMTWTGDTTLTLRKNATAMNPTLVFTAADDDTYKVDTTNNSDEIAVDDDVAVSFTTAAGSGSSAIKGTVYTLVTTDGTFFVGAASELTRINRPDVQAVTISGKLQELTAEVEADVKMSIPFDATITKLRAMSYAETVDDDVTVTLRVNAADSALSVTFADGVTGVLTDTGSVSVSAGDDLNYRFDASVPSTGRRDFRQVMLVMAEAVGGATMLQIPHHQRGGFNPMHGGFSA